MNIQEFCVLMQEAMECYCSSEARHYISHCIDMERKLIKISYYIVDDVWGEETDTYFISFEEMNKFLMQLKYEHDEFIDAWFMFYNNIEIKE